MKEVVYKHAVKTILAVVFAVALLLLSIWAIEGRSLIACVCIYTLGIFVSEIFNFIDKQFKKERE